MGICQAAKHVRDKSFSLHEYYLWNACADVRPIMSHLTTISSLPVSVNLLALLLGICARQALHQESLHCAAVGTGSGRYGAVGFSYGSGAQADASSGSDDSGSDFSDEDDEADGDEATDALAANLGIDNFTSMQRRAERLEEAERLGKVIKPK